MEQSMRKVFRLIALAVLLLPGAALAFNVFSMRDMPVSYMTDEDREILESAVFSVLDNGRDGESAHWENGKTGAHGELTPRATFVAEGRSCRDLEVANSARGRNNRLVITLCRQAEGKWKIEPQ
jgi:surface antigen